MKLSLLTKPAFKRVSRTMLLSPSSSARFLSTLTDQVYSKPPSVEQWEKLAAKELGKSDVTVDSLRTERVTPEGIAIQPVYYDMESDNPEMPGVFPYTRGPYATMYTRIVCSWRAAPPVWSVVSSTNFVEVVGFEWKESARGCIPGQSVRSHCEQKR